MRHPANTKLRLIAALAAALLFSAEACAAPSFDCAKAQTASEKEVCRVPDLQWYDRQLARLFKIAKDQAGNPKELVLSQLGFIGEREACKADADCIERLYKERLAALAKRVNLYEAYAEYRSSNGTLWIVRFGFDAAVKILTVGDNGHTCAFETDSAPVGGKGVVRYAEAGGACRITIVPNDGDATLAVETKNCRDHCGVRAVMDGVYRRKN